MPLNELADQRLAHSIGIKICRVDKIAARRPVGFVDADFDDMLDLSFSMQYPQFVQGESFSAEVNVSEEQLGSMIKSSVELVKWCAHELRMQELASAKKDDDTNPCRIKFGNRDEK